MSEQEKKMLDDFIGLTEECISDLGVTPSKAIIKRCVTRINQDLCDLYDKYGINDTELRDGVFKTVKEVLIMGGLMKVKSLISSYDLTKDKEYDVIFEYETVYEIMIDNGNIACRNKDFFELID